MILYPMYPISPPIVFINRSSTSKTPTFMISWLVSINKLKKNVANTARKKAFFLLITIGIINPNGLNAKIFPNRFVTTASVDNKCLYLQNRLISLNNTKFTWEVSYPVLLPYRSLNNIKIK